MTQGLAIPWFEKTPSSGVFLVQRVVETLQAELSCILQGADIQFEKWKCSTRQAECTIINFTVTEDGSLDASSSAFDWHKVSVSFLVQSSALSLTCLTRPLRKSARVSHGRAIQFVQNGLSIPKTYKLLLPGTENGEVEESLWRLRGISIHSLYRLSGIPTKRLPSPRDGGHRALRFPCIASTLGQILMNICSAEPMFELSQLAQEPGAHLLLVELEAMGRPVDPVAFESEGFLRIGRSAAVPGGEAREARTLSPIRSACLLGPRVSSLAKTRRLARGWVGAIFFRAPKRYFKEKVGLMWRKVPLSLWQLEPSWEFLV